MTTSSLDEYAAYLRKKDILRGLSDNRRFDAWLRSKERKVEMIKKRTIETNKKAEKLAREVEKNRRKVEKNRREVEEKRREL